MRSLPHSADSCNRNYLDWQVDLRRAGFGPGLLAELANVGIYAASDTLGRSLRDLRRIHRIGNTLANRLVALRDMRRGAA